MDPPSSQLDPVSDTVLVAAHANDGAHAVDDTVDDVRDHDAMADHDNDAVADADAVLAVVDSDDDVAVVVAAAVVAATHVCTEFHSSFAHYAKFENLAELSELSLVV